ncbi:MAG: ATP-binding protein [Chitinophagales bacterium]
MLIRFVVSNFLSFAEETEFNMLTGSVRRKKDHEYHFGDLSLLKTAAIYGANGAGKSNLVKAIGLLQKIVTTGEWNYFTDIQTFRLNPDYAEKPTSFEIEFVMEGKSYSYGLSLFQNVIVEEWLYLTNFGKEDILVFNRTTNQDGITKIEVNDKYFQSAKDKLRIKLYEDELLLNDKPLIKQLAEAKQVFEEVEEVNNWFIDSLLILSPLSKPTEIVKYMAINKNFRTFIGKFISSLNTGISGIGVQTYSINDFFGKNEKEKIEDVSNQVKNKGNAILKRSDSLEEVLAVEENNNVLIKRFYTKHFDGKGNEYSFLLPEESDGTKRLIDYIAMFFMYLHDEVVFIIDEIEISIHPYLLKELLSKIMSNENSKGQLIFTTHESHLLDQEIFRQDEIWFTEKDKGGATNLYPLSDFKVRFDLDIRKGYLNGRFGAIPFLADLENLNWNDYAEEKAGV